MHMVDNSDIFKPSGSPPKVHTRLRWWQKGLAIALGYLTVVAILKLL